MATELMLKVGRYQPPKIQSSHLKKLVWTMSFVAPVTCASLICSQAPRAPNFLLSPPFSNPCHCSEHKTLSKANAQKLQIHSLILLQINKRQPTMNFAKL